MRTLLQIIYQICALLQLFIWGSVILLQSAPLTDVSAVHAIHGAGTAHERAAGSAPDVGASASTLGVDATGGAPAAGATLGA